MAELQSGLRYIAAMETHLVSSTEAAANCTVPAGWRVTGGLEQWEGRLRVDAEDSGGARAACELVAVADGVRFAELDVTLSAGRVLTSVEATTSAVCPFYFAPHL